MVKNSLAKAIAIVAVAFQDKLDKGGQPYILHCLRVMNDVGDDNVTKVVAVLHDLLEDCPEWTVRKLDALAFTDAVIVPLYKLTHKEDVPYDQYIRDLSSDPIARVVKMADLRDNSNITRLKGLRKKDIERMEKYHWAYTYLTN